MVATNDHQQSLGFDVFIQRAVLCSEECESDLAAGFNRFFLVVRESVGAYRSTSVS
jgi:hypothetical protein